MEPPGEGGVNRAFQIPTAVRMRGTCIKKSHGSNSADLETAGEITLRVMREDATTSKRTDVGFRVEGDPLSAL